MFYRRHNRIATLWVLLPLIFQGTSIAQKYADPSQIIKPSLTIEFDALVRQKPGIVKVKVQNISGRDVDVKAICSFELLSLAEEAVARKHSVFGDSYWAPVKITTGTPLPLNILEPDMLKKGVVVGSVPEEVLHFATGETKSFSTDLTKLFWNAQMGNDWPRWNLFESVPGGKYSLVFVIESGGRVKSNEVTVSVE
jgi:hypothetical protein